MKQFAVIGLGRFGASIAKALYALGHDVLAVDDDQGKINDIADYVTHAICADATDEHVLNTLGLRNFDVVVIAIASDLQASILIPMLCKEMGVPKVIAKAQSEMHARVLEKIGVDRVIFPERDMGVRLAHSLVSTSVLDYIDFSDEYSIVEVRALPEWYQKSLREIKMRSTYGVNVIAIRHIDRGISVSPNADDLIQEGDSMVIVGSNECIQKLDATAVNANHRFLGHNR